MATEPSPDNVRTLTLTLGMPWLPCSGCFKGSTHNVGHQESPQVGRQRDVASSTGDANGREVPFTPPAIPLCLGSCQLPRAAVKPVESSPVYSHFLQTRK